MNGSGKVSPARLAAFEVLLQVETRAAYSHIALRQALRRQRLDRRNSALATEIVYGVLQWQRWLDERLARYSRIPVDRLDPPVRVALRMAAYQLLKLKGVAAHAAVYDAVELVKAALPRAAGFANGLLRSVLRRPPAEDESALPAGTPEAVARVTSHPTWMVQHWWEWLGPDTTERFCRSNNEPSVLTLRANTLRSSPAEVAEAVRAAGGEAEVSPVVPEAVRVAGGVDVSTLPPFRTGACTVQDESAMLAAYTLVPEPGWRILDLCAAPGGKASHLAERMGGRGEVVAVDIHPHKIELIQEAAQRLGLSHVVRPLCMDGRSARELGTFDAALVDAPCSGLGVLRRRPELKWRRAPRDIPELAALQLELLRAAAQAVRAGGILVYATCTVTVAENDGVIEAFLRCPEGRDFEVDDASRHWPELARSSAVKTRFGRQILPFHFGGDGFFYARLRRHSS